MFKALFSSWLLLAAAGCADDTGPGDAAARPDVEPDVQGSPIGVCESFPARVELKTADGKPTIATVDVNGPCYLAGAACGRPTQVAPPTCDRDGGIMRDGGTIGGSDGGAAGCASVLILARSYGSCGVRITSVSGEQVCAAVEILRRFENTSCRDSVGRVFTPVPYLEANPRTIAVQFGTADGGMADGGADAGAGDTGADAGSNDTATADSAAENASAAAATTGT